MQPIKLIINIEVPMPLIVTLFILSLSLLGIEIPPSESLKIFDLDVFSSFSEERHEKSTDSSKETL